jgi:hypothetical protein
MTEARDPARQLIREDMIRTGYGLTFREKLGFATLYALCVLLGVIGLVACLVSLYEFWWIEWMTDGTIVVSAVATVIFAVFLFRRVTNKRARLAGARWDNAE